MPASRKNVRIEIMENQDIFQRKIYDSDLPLAEQTWTKM